MGLDSWRCFVVAYPGMNARGYYCGETTVNGRECEHRMELSYAVLAWNRACDGGGECQQKISLHLGEPGVDVLQIERLGVKLAAGPLHQFLMAFVRWVL